ncbi:sirohydrochlorin cobaltochelatase [Desulfobaculum xiamenense]|uniref:Sirohydrochlorin cobaltochelatase n=1 Tax=Desulfobaculum xiamenense TaxID=995050 RepID=A0A846QKY8_9BACT|nr:sirohydrochlorin cobaltochelatase [Desulfobaculum xiamenense]NJB67122.1 sirohydrochlorin cobaltochelatase [Desulfobaculum xiamenense]
MKKGILLVAFGSSREAAHLSLRRFDDAVRLRFPKIPARWAFTSGVVRGKLADKGKKTDSVTKALEKMWFEKFTHVAVQSLHVIPGDEFHDLVQDADRFRGGDRGFESIVLGRPLIAGPEDVPAAADAVMAALPPERTPDEAVVLMGHGTWHAGDCMYDALYDELRSRDENVLVATMEGRLVIGDITRELVERRIGRAWLVPLLAVPGRHVQKDMCGSGPESWVNILAAAGIEPRCVLRGTAEYGDFPKLWLDHLEEAMRDL